MWAVVPAPSPGLPLGACPVLLAALQPQHAATAGLSAQCAGYKLRQRALHVYQEAARVPQFRDACNSSAGGQATMAELARLMNDSQTSCRWARLPQVMRD